MLRIATLLVANSVWEDESSYGTSVDEIVCRDILVVATIGTHVDSN